MNTTSEKHFKQHELISVKQQAPVRRLQGSPSHAVGALNHLPSHEAQDGASRPPSPSPIRFYDQDKPYYSFTNFSPDPVYFNQHRYPTSEHLFQALKVGMNVADLKRVGAHNIVLTSSWRHTLKSQKVFEPAEKALAKHLTWHTSIKTTCGPIGER